MVQKRGKTCAAISGLASNEHKMGHVCMAGWDCTLRPWLNLVCQCVTHAWCTFFCMCVSTSELYRTISTVAQVHVALFHSTMREGGSERKEDKGFVTGKTGDERAKCQSVANVECGDSEL